MMTTDSENIGLIEETEYMLSFHIQKHLSKPDYLIIYYLNYSLLRRIYIYVIIVIYIVVPIHKELAP